MSVLLNGLFSTNNSIKSTAGLDVVQVENY